MAIVLRSSKSVPLTFTEMDNNFSELGSRATTLEANYVKTVNGISATSNALTITTANITEATNLYYTDARSRAAISVTDVSGDGSLSYNNSTGVITYTGPSAAEVRAHFSAGEGIDISSGVVSGEDASTSNKGIASFATAQFDVTSGAVSIKDATTSVKGIASFSTDHFAVSSGAVTLKADGIDDTHIDFGTGANQVSTADLPEQTNLYYTNARADARIAAADLTDLNDVSYSSPTTNHVLTWSGTGWIAAEAPGAAGGEANTISNIGTGAEIADGKVGVDLRFRRIDTASDNLIVNQNGNSVQISMASAPEFGNLKINSAANTIENISTNADIVLKPNGTGTVKTEGNIVIPNAGNIGSVGDTDAIAISAGGVVTMNQIPVFSAGINVSGGTIAGTLATAAQTNITSVGTLNGLAVAASQTITMGSNKVTNVTDPSNAQDAATKNYVDTRGITFARVGGNSTVANLGGTVSFQGTANEVTVGESSGTFTIGLPSSIIVGSADIASVKITGNKVESDVSNADLTLDANGTGHINVSGNQIHNVLDPTGNQHAATKAYVDSSISSLNSDKILEGNSSVEVVDTGTGSVVITVDGVAEQTIVSASTTFGGNLIIPDAGNIGSASDTDAMSIAAGGDVTMSQGLIVTGNLTVNGTTTTLNTAEMKVEDKNITVADGAADSAAADGAGLTIDGAGASITYAHSGTKFVFNKPIDAGSNSITSSGGFVGNVTGNTSGSSGSCTGNAATATALETARAIAVSGDVVGTANFDGTAGISISTTIQANSVALGTDTTGNYVAAGATSGNGISGSVSSEGGTFTVTSNATNANTGSTIVFRDGSGDFSAGTITATATQAQYADLAEMYMPDVDYAPGTVMIVGGEAEITSADSSSSILAGVISTDPAFLMNSAAEGHPLALVGRVPVRVTGAINKGQAVFAADNGVASADATGPIVGIALESSDDTSEKLIECMLKV